MPARMRSSKSTSGDRRVSNPVIALCVPRLERSRLHAGNGVENWSPMGAEYRKCVPPVRAPFANTLFQ